MLHEKMYANNRHSRVSARLSQKKKEKKTQGKEFKKEMAPSQSS
jgi:hypothetical protein